jgi:hypothetical protein
MKTLRQLLVIGLMVAMTGSLAAAQTFTGGLRGAVKDANGVIPGVTVELINEGTSTSRESCPTSRSRIRAAIAPVRRLTIKTCETKGVASAQQFITLDIS